MGERLCILALENRLVKERVVNKNRMLKVVPGAEAGLWAAVRYRRWHLRWGATDAEVAETLPGDEMCAHPNFAFTRAITIHARPEDIWPWLVQVGFGRAGWYSYDLLDNLGRHSAERVIPELQHLEIGDVVPMGAVVNDTTVIRVKDFDPYKWLLWEHLGDSWVWVLKSSDDHTTRLITRGRQRYHWKSPMVISELILMEIGDFSMMRKLLLNLKRRAENLAHERQSVPAQSDSTHPLEIDNTSEKVEAIS